MAHPLCSVLKIIFHDCETEEDKWNMNFLLSFVISQLKNFKLTNGLLEIVGVELHVCPCVSLFCFCKTSDEASHLMADIFFLTGSSPFIVFKSNYSVLTAEPWFNFLGNLDKSRTGDFG